MLENVSVVRSIDRGVNVQFIGQGPRRPYTLFLRRHADDHVIQRGLEGIDVSSGELVDRRQKTSGARQAGGSLIRVGKVKHRRQIATDRTAPWRDVWLEYSETLLYELDHGRMIEDLRINVSSLAPG